MAEEQGRTERRHVREKATIDHLVEEVFEPTASDHEPTVHSPTTPAGVPIEDQVRKEWNPRENGGLPTFIGDESSGPHDQGS